MKFVIFGMPTKWAKWDVLQVYYLFKSTVSGSYCSNKLPSRKYDSLWLKVIKHTAESCRTIWIPILKSVTDHCKIWLSKV